ncbi:TcpE family conjugal transfer membrane protein [Ureibacillus sp. FSL W8-0352]|uniref:TcpE family conjugal transfer membrane protein n=1 Tax=Ureibacillus sp. FSL W8-0352 TaxID=2954596 RepID=UPI0030F94ECA
MNRVPLFVLNNFLKFERKIYQIFGLKLGRPLSAKMALYAIFFGVLEFIIYKLPIIGNLINWLPFAILVIIPMLLGWLLADVGTEGRSPIFFFRSFFAYQKRKWIDKSTLYRGRKNPKNTNYQFRNYFTFREPLMESESLLLDNAFEGVIQENKEEKERVSSHEDKLTENEKSNVFIPSTESTEFTNQEEPNNTVKTISDISEVQEIKEPLTKDIDDIEVTTNTQVVENIEDINDMSERTNAISGVNPISEPIHTVITDTSNTADEMEEVHSVKEKAVSNPKPQKTKQSHLHISQQKKIPKTEKSKDQPSRIQYLRMAIRYRSRMKKTRKKG